MPIKLLFTGDSGAGKTGALASLVKAGFSLYVVDFDNGADIIRHYLRGDPKWLRQLHVVTLTDRMTVNGGRVFPAEAKAWRRGVELLEKWPDKGPIHTWGENDVLVIDSLTMAGRFAANFHQMLNSRLAVPPTWQDYRHIQDYVMNLLSLLYSDAVPCNVIVITHIDYRAPPGTPRSEAEKQEDLRGYPSSAGSAIGPKIGRFFNAVLLARTDGATRSIYTRSRDSIELKNPAPEEVKYSYPLSSGLADYFAVVRRGQAGASVPTPDLLSRATGEKP